MATFHDLDERTHVYPVLAPADIAANATNTSYVDMSKYNSVQFLIVCGAADTVGALSMEQCDTDDSGGTEAGLGFWYRKSGAVATDTFGTATHINSDSSVATLAADDACIYILEPDQLTDGYRWCRAVFTPSGTASATIVGAVAICKGARYPQNAMVSVS